VAIVTGAGSGIGRAMAGLLAERGAFVVVADIDEAAGRETVSLIEGAGGRAAFIRTDVTKWDDLEAMVAFAEARFGGLDILHNNAGINTGRPRYPEAPRERWELTLAIDLWGVIAGVDAAVPAMRRRGGGVIVNTASLAGVVAFPPDPVYAAAKHGIVGLTRSLAFLKDEANIRVNAVCPGVVQTPLLEKRDLSEEDAAVIAQMPLIPPSQVAEGVLAFVEDDSLAGEVMGILYGKPPKLIPPAITLREDPSARMKS
jgi:NAD(P)-dependent dehydrogenase (short-subunit alcohol dehydrogenase family)